MRPDNLTVQQLLCMMLLQRNSKREFVIKRGGRRNQYVRSSNVKESKLYWTVLPEVRKIFSLDDWRV